MYKYTFRVITILFCLTFSSCLTLSDSSTYFRKASYEANRKNYDIAFMQLRALLNDDPNSPYAPKAAFSTGEYFLHINDYADAMATFYNYIKHYPDDPGVIFAEFIMYDISTKIKTGKYVRFKEQDLIDNLGKKIFAKPMFFLFSDKEKSYSYRSVFGNVYTAYDYVDRIEVKRNGKLFIEISP